MKEIKIVKRESFVEGHNFRLLSRPLEAGDFDIVWKDLQALEVLDWDISAFKDAFGLNLLRLGIKIMIKSEVRSALGEELVDAMSKCHSWGLGRSKEELAEAAVTTAIHLSEGVEGYTRARRDSTRQLRAKTAAEKMLRGEGFEGLTGEQILDALFERALEKANRDVNTAVESFMNRELVGALTNFSGYGTQLDKGLEGEAKKALRLLNASLQSVESLREQIAMLVRLQKPMLDEVEAGRKELFLKLLAENEAEHGELPFLLGEKLRQESRLKGLRPCGSGMFG